MLKLIYVFLFSIYIKLIYLNVMLKKMKLKGIKDIYFLSSSVHNFYLGPSGQTSYFMLVSFLIPKRKHPFSTMNMHHIKDLVYKIDLFIYLRKQTSVLGGYFFVQECE